MEEGVRGYLGIPKREEHEQEHHPCPIKEEREKCGVVGPTRIQLERSHAALELFNWISVVQNALSFFSFLFFSFFLLMANYYYFYLCFWLIITNYYININCLSLIVLYP